eukprot:TRINITY_DN5969_c0_g2_i1.p1 TRINITY_DN5969_c0_g2~~TRINITY_DN5969_c0_g2_i1.p1  ORF type:complete len:1194 (+),score=289.92 TRINITY_DN5969_c0_g2_i1:68-3583(+)
MDGLIKTIPPGLFKNCQQLTHLFLGKQQLTELRPDQTAGLTKLMVFMLNFNSFTELDGKLIDALPNLMVFGLRGNHIAKLNLARCRHAKLQQLWLKSNNIVEIPKDTFNGFTSLRVLEMDGNPTECMMIDGSAACLCQAGTTGPVASAYGAGALTVHRFCLPDACVADRLTPAITQACQNEDCWIADGHHYTSNVCKCSKRRVDCDAIGLAHLPPNIPADTAQLAMFMNDLTEFPSLQHLPNLYMADFRANKIKHFPSAHEVLPTAFAALSEDLSFNYTHYLATTGDHELVSKNIAGSTHTFVPTTLGDSKSLLPATFTGAYTFGGLGTIGNPSKCTYASSGNFSCISCALGYVNDGSSCVPPSEPKLVSWVATPVKPKYRDTVTINIFYSTIVRSTRDANQHLQLEDFSNAGESGEQLSCDCSDDEMTQTTTCLVEVIPRQNIDRSYYLIIGAGSFQNVAGLTNEPAYIAELQFDTISPQMWTDVQVFGTSARSGEAPFQLMLSFDEPVQALGDWAEAVLSERNALSVQLAEELSDTVVTFNVLPKRSPTTDQVIGVVINSSMITDLAGNSLGATQRLDFHFGPPCPNGFATAVNLKQLLGQPQKCLEAESTDALTRRLSIAVPVTAVLLVAALLAFVWYVRRQRSTINLSDIMKDVRYQHLAHLFSDAEIGSGASLSSLPPLKPPTEISRGCIETGNKIGEGFFGTVFRGHVTLADDSVDVAIKTVKDETKARSLIEESVIMAQLDHPNLVRLVGVHTTSSPAMLMLEFCHNGSLDHFLKSHAKGVAKLTHAQQLSIIVDVLGGMSYLENLKLIHRDLAARNVLLTTDFQCRIADLGMARFGRDEDDYYIAAQNTHVPVRWMAPEALNDSVYSTQSDVWSFGILLVEIFQFGGLPYEGWSSIRVVQEVSAGHRHSQPTECPKHIYEIMLKTWLEDKWQRPTFKQLLGQFDGLLKREYSEIGVSVDSGYGYSRLARGVSARSSSSRSRKSPLSSRQLAVEAIARQSKRSIDADVTTLTTMEELDRARQSSNAGRPHRSRLGSEMSSVSFQALAKRSSSPNSPGSGESNRTEDSKVPDSESDSDISFCKEKRGGEEEEAFGGGVSDYVDLLSAEQQPEVDHTVLADIARPSPPLAPAPPPRSPAMDKAAEIKVSRYSFEVPSLNISTASVV